MNRECEFKEECEKLWASGRRDCVSDVLLTCTHRKLGILVWNRALVEYQEYIDRCVETWKRAVGSRMGVNQKEFVSRVREKGDILKMEMPR